MVGGEAGAAPRPDGRRVPPSFLEAHASDPVWLRFEAHQWWVAEVTFAAAVQEAQVRPWVAAWPWPEIAQCESSGNWSDTAGSFEGGLQFSHQTWLAYGGGRFAGHAYDASEREQVTIAVAVQHGQGWGAWPVCSRHVGL